MINTLKKGLATGALVLAGAGSIFAQFTLDGQYRPRLEVRHGFKKPIVKDAGAAAFVEHRARLTAGYNKDKMGFKMSIQDVRVWGEVGQINKSDHLLSAHEAYGDYKPSAVSTFRIGRQELAYDGHRFMGTLNWAAQARSFDAARYIYKNDSSGLSFDIALTYNQDGGIVGAPEPAKLSGTHYTTGGGKNAATIFNLPLPKAQQIFYIKKKFDGGDVGLFVENDIKEANTNEGIKHYNQQHLGLSPNLKTGDLKFGAQAFYSMGTAGLTATGEKVDLGGYFANLTVQHTGITGKPMIGVDYISGDDNTTADKVEGWAPLYGTNHKFYGFMDYFYVGNGHGGGNNASAGLTDIYLKTTFKTGEKSKLLAHVHYFMSNADREYTDKDGALTNFKGGLGTELDLVYVRTLAPGVVLKAGYSHMFGITDNMKALKFNSEGVANENTEIEGMQNWAWVMINFAPKFLN